jgi:hypothetical protein
LLLLFGVLLQLLLLLLLVLWPMNHPLLHLSQMFADLQRPQCRQYLLQPVRVLLLLLLVRPVYLPVVHPCRLLAAVRM